VGQVIIISLNLGSLKVEFSVSEVSQTAAEGAVAVIQTSSAAVRFPSTSQAYATENNGASPSIGLVTLVSAATPQAMDTGSNPIADIVTGIVVGGVALVIVVAIGIVIVRRRSNAQKALREAEAEEEEMMRCQPLLSTLSAEKPAKDHELADLL
jgi:hypothetical protein